MGILKSHIDGEWVDVNIQGGWMKSFKYVFIWVNGI